ncbi:MAG: 16S rRNA (adenine(1518)-N(6)/adenine(1519)-N(6))-dimethyltransferase, partial [Clostridium sp.]
SKEKIVEAIEKMGLPQAVRGETLTLKQFAELSNYLLP